MAHLKGGTYVDGDLYVDGALQISSLKLSHGDYFPYISKSSNSSIEESTSIPKLSSNSGELIPSELGIGVGENNNIYLKVTGNSGDTPAENGKLFIKNHPIEIVDDSVDGSKWIFKPEASS